MLSRILKRNPINSEVLSKLCKSTLPPESLDFAFNVAKRLDEHRETVEDLLASTNYLSWPYEHPWRISHLANQDDYLMYLFYLRHSTWPLDKITPKLASLGDYRPRPKILGRCAHPLFIRDFGVLESIPFEESDVYQAYESNVRNLISRIIQTCYSGPTGTIDLDNSSIHLPLEPVDFITQAILLYAKKISPDTARVISDFSADQHGINKFKQACLYYQDILSKIEIFYPIEFLINEIEHSPIHLRRVYDNVPKVLI